MAELTVGQALEIAAEDAVMRVLRRRSSWVTASELAETVRLPKAVLDAALKALAAGGMVERGLMDQHGLVLTVWKAASVQRARAAG